MKPARIQRRTVPAEAHLAALGLCLLLAGTGCGRRAQQQRSANLGQQAQSRDAQPKPPDDAGRTMRLGWNRLTLVTEYDRIGNRNAAWDTPARNALEAFARMRAAGALGSTNDVALVRQNCQLAADNGCFDPLVTYLHLRFPTRPQSATQIADRYLALADSMTRSQYPMVRKFYTSLRAAEAVEAGYRMDSEKSPVVTRLVGQAAELLQAMTREKTFPDPELFEACDALLEQSVLKGQVDDNRYFEIEKALFKGWSKESFPHLVKGHFYLNYAWRARGSGYGNSVSKQGWKDFAIRLEIAEEALSQAWLLDPSQTRVAHAFQRLELGQGRGKDRQELWFQRGMRLNPANYDACAFKLYYLEPKWYGSPEEMLRFGRECVAQTEWRGTVPLILVDAHWKLANYVPQEQRDAYWKQPGVWEDIKSSYDRYFQSNPNDNGRLAYYARYATWCEKWDALEQLLKRLELAGAGNFKGRADYEKALQAARSAKSPPK
jgi:hypothetical protein